MASQLPTTNNTVPTKATPLNEAVGSVANTVQRGNVPSNAQMTQVLGEASHLLEEKKAEAPLTPTGKKIASQMQEVLGNTATLIRDKNPNDTLQKLAVDAKAAGKEASKSLAAADAKKLGEDVASRTTDATKEATSTLTGEAKTLKEQTKTAASVAANAALDAAREIISSAEFRQLIIDVLSILQQSLRTAADTIEETSEEATAKLQEAKERVASGESTEKIAKDAKSEAKEKITQSKEELKANAQQMGKDAKAKLKEIGERARTEANEVISGRKDALELLPLSEQQRSELRDRFDAVLKRIGAVESYRRATDAIFRLFDQYSCIFAQAVPEAKAIAEEAKDELGENERVKRVWAEARILVERWTNGRTLDTMLARSREVYDSITTDPDLRAWWGDLRAYSREVMDKPQEGVTEERSKRFNELFDRGRRLYTEKVEYNKALRGVWTEARTLLNAIRNDATINRLGESLRKLGQTLFLDTNGNPALKPEELRQFKLLIASLVAEEFKFVPLARFTGSTDSYDFALSNMSIYAFDVLPEHLLFKAYTRGDIDLKDVDARLRTTFSFALTNMHLAMKNVMFWFRKKHGLIRMEDAGIADFAIAGRGASIEIEFDYTAGQERTVLVRGVRCLIDKLNLHVVDSRHDWLLNMAEPFFVNDIKHEIEHSIAKRIADRVDAAFYNLRALLPDTSSLKSVGDAVKQEIKDAQAVRDRLEVTPNPHA